MSERCHNKEQTSKLASQVDSFQSQDLTSITGITVNRSNVFRRKHEIRLELVNSSSVSTSKILENEEFVLWSDEETNSPRKKLKLCCHSEQIPNFRNEDGQGQERKITGVPERNKIDIIDLLKNNTMKFCPVCCKKNVAGQNNAFIVHLKSCAVKNNLSTEQLLKAIELHQKQVNERTALGLPTVQEKPSVKRPFAKKGTVDSNLELAIALSVSLRESELVHKMRETEMLLEAGLENEALSQCRKLENFGFVVPVPNNVNSSLKYIHRRENIRSTVLFTRSQEERERILTEKIAMILVASDTPCEHTLQTDTRLYDELKSKFLKKYLDLDSTLWKKSYHLSADNESDFRYYYCENLSTFVSPCELPVGAKLKRLSQIPFRIPSPSKTAIEDSSLRELAAIYSQHEPNTSIKSEVSNPMNRDFGMQKAPDYSKLSQAWKSLVNKNVLSDVSIYAKNERLIYAHKLVLHVRCPSILTETIKEYENGKCSEMVMWMNYDYETIVVFLEYLYSGDLIGVNKLNEKQRMDLKALSSNYEVIEVKKAVEKMDRFEEESVKLESESKVLDLSESPEIVRLTEGEMNLRLLELELEAQISNPTPASSPEMFVSTDTLTKDHIEFSPGMQEMIDADLFSTPKSCFNSDEFHVQSVLESEKRKFRPPFEERNGKKLKLVNECLSESISIHDTSNRLDTKLSSSELSIALMSSRSSDSDTYSFETRAKQQEQRITKNVALDGSYTRSPEVDEPGKKSPYISPVWDGFEDMWYNRIEDEYPIEVNDRAKISPSRNSLKLCEKFSVSGELRPSSEPFFDSFDVDTSELDRLVEGEISKTQPIMGRGFECQITTPRNVRKLKCRSKSDDVLTPVSKKTVHVTPMADYSNMKTKELRKELDRYGLKPGLNRCKAKKLLRYIYDQLHSHENDLRQGGEIICSLPASNSRRDFQNEESIEDKENDSDECSTLSSGVEFLEESFQEEDANVLSQDINDSAQSKRISLDVGFKNLIEQDKNLHQKILLYEPLWLDSLKISLKEINVKCSTNELMNYLDEKSITFRTSQMRKKRKRRVNT